MTSITVTEARKLLYRLLDEVNESHDPVHIAGKRNAGVLISEEDWRAITETLHLCEIPGMRESIVKGMKEPLDKCPEDPGW
jgi:prevent-host-death family protein